MRSTQRRRRWPDGQHLVRLAAMLTSSVGLRLALAQPAGGDPSPPAATMPIAVDVDVPPACPPDAAARVVERATGARLARAGEPAPRLLLRIIAVDTWFVGAVGVESGGARAVIRQVHGAGCDEVLGALVLIAALTLDGPSVEVEALPTPRQAFSQPLGPAPMPWAPWQPPPIPARRTERAAPLRAGIGVGFGIASGLAPHVVPGGTLVAEIGVPGDAPVGLLRAGAGYWASPEVPAATLDAAATYRAILARVDACVVALRRDAAWAAPCATLDLGSLTGEGVVGRAVETASARSVLWVAPGPAVRAGLEVAGPLVLAVEGAVVFPLSRDAFVFEEPAAVAHQVPPAALRTGIEIGVLFR